MGEWTLARTTLELVLAPRSQPRPGPRDPDRRLREARDAGGRGRSLRSPVARHRRAWPARRRPLPPGGDPAHPPRRSRGRARRLSALVGSRIPTSCRRGSGSSITFGAQGDLDVVADLADDLRHVQLSPSEDRRPPGPAGHRAVAPARSTVRPPPRSPLIPRWRARPPARWPTAPAGNKSSKRAASDSLDPLLGRARAWAGSGEPALVRALIDLAARGPDPPGTGRRPRPAGGARRPTGAGRRRLRAARLRHPRRLGGPAAGRPGAARAGPPGGRSHRRPGRPSRLRRAGPARPRPPGAGAARVRDRERRPEADRGERAAAGARRRAAAASAICSARRPFVVAPDSVESRHRRGPAAAAGGADPAGRPARRGGGRLRSSDARLVVHRRARPRDPAQRSVDGGAGRRRGAGPAARGGARGAGRQPRRRAAGARRRRLAVAARRRRCFSAPPRSGSRRWPPSRRRWPPCPTGRRSRAAPSTPATGSGSSAAPIRAPRWSC